MPSGREQSFIRMLTELSGQDGGLTAGLNKGDWGETILHSTCHLQMFNIPLRQVMQITQAKRGQRELIAGVIQGSTFTGPR